METLQNRKKIASTYAKYIISCDKIKNQDDVNLASLQRVLQLNCKTTLLKGIVLMFKLKHSNVSVQIIHIPKNSLYNHYFKIKVSSLPTLEMSICAQNTKELMYKINHVYKFIKPINHEN
ncbi:hypothetical protein [Flavobacterium yafengii]|uniref:hypothetical protein n=1 Tax=Flavobacterium yafengii TaxID=3041253 RepID=UPI0024A7C7A4|nr:hypothetical protein [Flavobacterium yafengii]MDI5888730.1 hypothetical protein [Flavobacterium yafengii]